MKILALNCGSSSIKYKVFAWGKQEVLVEGQVERIGIADGCVSHEVALKQILKELPEIAAVGHRVVHGGEKFKSSMLITPEVLEEIKKVKDLAPLHNPPNIEGIESAQKVWPKIPHIAVFDTAFHQTMPEIAYTYAVPYEWYKMYGVRRYGFHGTSHLYVSRRAAVMLKKPVAETNVITMHIGNGVSIAAIKNGISVDTSMGLTPLEGAVMGTRSGDIDPGILLFMIEKEGFYADQLDNILNKKSGLFGITGKYMDRRDIYKSAEAGDQRAQLAIDIEVYRLKKYLGAYLAVLGKLDALVFTAGAGEKNWKLRERVLEGCEGLGLVLDREKNRVAKSHEVEADISFPGSQSKILVIPTDEERVFIEDVVAILENRYDVHTKFTYSFERPDYQRTK
ncbi:propionate kinase [candidate division WOR-1 bacterium RIFOXYA12_FULL_43_27]|uniref:Acetate kinase n=1 Tax=candidate division WOR-1 bacterium RIFOXYC2_FULL_46_14 TaxID=1802587 RepID=A0A1F4U4V3_UNCSA|nr:MAG: propionate kinase [candidate division WOR-1 bacterium RIFOXYA12_FULL_43_27]OGC20773.1 MAG: propionate kinase [candidate division WOR-1 bacterium RIFOXYB2_FULL_46_45]OGC31490.1 MAG: propionate kinase [candidate division WOR-1 bacterium RIFOXYA2_FULL_46_56]OGC39897.1 MAG: propionate kinase [candidate division WOR-1 bacterium RIFOXYC2_FULL_46_14]